MNTIDNDFEEKTDLISEEIRNYAKKLNMESIKKNDRKVKKRKEISQVIMIVLIIIAIGSGWVTTTFAFCVPEEAPISEGFWLFNLVCCVLSSIGIIRMIVNGLTE